MRREIPIKIILKFKSDKNYKIFYEQLQSFLIKHLKEQLMTFF